MNCERKFVAFRNGALISDIVLANIIWAAFRGKMTESGKSLVLVPDRRFGSPDALGLKKMNRVRRSECVTLEDYVRETLKTFDVTLSGGGLKFTPKKNRRLASTNSGKSANPTNGIGSANLSPSRNTCRVCNKDLRRKRADTKFCSPKCRQRAHRQGVFSD